jgi:glycerophosphoryl diester phosphodiesterase
MRTGVVAAALAITVVFGAMHATHAAYAASAATPAPSCPQPAVVAHRGDSSRYTQETRSAYLGAIRARAILDTDVRFTRTAVPVLLHDPALDVFGSSRRIADVSLHYAKRLRSSSGARIFTLWQFARLMRAHPGTTAQIELKVDPTRHEWHLIDRRLRRLGSRVTLASFHTATVRGEQHHGYRTGLISDDRVRPATARSYGSEFYLWFRNVSARYARALRVVGVEIFAWTVDSPVQWRHLPRTAGVITDDPSGYIRWHRAGCAGSIR